MFNFYFVRLHKINSIKKKIQYKLSLLVHYSSPILISELIHFPFLLPIANFYALIKGLILPPPFFPIILDFVAGPGDNPISQSFGVIPENPPIPPAAAPPPFSYCYYALIPINLLFFLEAIIESYGLDAF